MTTTDPLERVVHAHNYENTIELVRYDRAGRWKLEWKDGSKKYTVAVKRAASLAAIWEQMGGTVLPGRYGGSAFIREVEKWGFKS